MVSFPHPLQEALGNFSLIFTENLVEFQEVKSANVWGPSAAWIPGAFISQTCSDCLQRFVNYGSDFSMKVSALVSCDSLAICPVTSLLLQIKQKLLIF